MSKFALLSLQILNSNLKATGVAKISSAGYSCSLGMNNSLGCFCHLLLTYRSPSHMCITLEGLEHARLDHPWFATGAYIFQRFEAWQHPGLSPTPSEALKLLHRLAADPGIVGIMTKHCWSVGLLSEMPPEGKVGVSPVCILGVNINAGQEISLRLRTDDLKGFRRCALALAP